MPGGDDKPSLTSNNAPASTSPRKRSRSPPGSGFGVVRDEVQPIHRGGGSDASIPYVCDPIPGGGGFCVMRNEVFLRVFVRVCVIGALKFMDWKYYAMEGGMPGHLLRRWFLQIKVYMALSPYF